MAFVSLSLPPRLICWRLAWRAGRAVQPGSEARAVGRCGGGGGARRSEADGQVVPRSSAVSAGAAGSEGVAVLGVAAGPDACAVGRRLRRRGRRARPCAALPGPVRPRTRLSGAACGGGARQEPGQQARSSTCGVQAERSTTAALRERSQRRRCISTAAAAEATDRCPKAGRTRPPRQAEPGRLEDRREPGPRCSTTTRSRSAAPARVACSTTTTVRPSSAVVRSRRMIACDAAGSRSAVGSSSRNTSGSVANARASMARRASPPEMRSTRAARNTSIPQTCKALVTGAVALSRCGMRPSAATCSTVSPQVQRAPCGSQATRRGSCVGRIRQQAGERAQQGGFAGAIRSAQRDKLAGPGGEADVAAGPRWPAQHHGADARRRSRRGSAARSPPGTARRAGPSGRRPAVRRTAAAPEAPAAPAGRRRAAAPHLPRDAAGSSAPGRSPIHGRSRCGTTRPTKPIEPATAAPAPTARRCRAPPAAACAATGTPRLRAVSSPRLSASRPRPSLSRIAPPSRITGAASSTCHSGRSARPPISQKVISASANGFGASVRANASNAEAMADTATPARISDGPDGARPAKPAGTRRRLPHRSARRPAMPAEMLPPSPSRTRSPRRGPRSR